MAKAEHIGSAEQSIVTDLRVHADACPFIASLVRQVIHAMLT
jgi:hypothetical protein